MTEIMSSDLKIGSLQVLRQLGLPSDEARSIASGPLPELEDSR